MEIVGFDVKTVNSNLERICNQIFALLPMREEGKDYVKPLDTLTVELTGMSKMVEDQPKLLSLICKLKGLRPSDESEVDFMLFRRTIFEACSMVTSMKGDAS